jgi:hypothetical protein
VRVAARIADSRARRRAAVEVRRASGICARGVVDMTASYDACNSELHECDVNSWSGVR